MLLLLGRLVDLGVIVADAGWILICIPGGRALPAAAVVAGGAVLGALVSVFQALWRVVVVSLVVIFDDRHAFGDTADINGLDFSACTGIDPAPSARGFTT